MLRSVLELLRPANVVTAFADVLAGFSAAGLQNGRALPWLLAATACLYAGGVVLNDVFDRAVDRVERPERPIPSGRVPVQVAAGLGAALLASGVLSAFQATAQAGVIATAIASLVLMYDAWGKRHPLVGPVNMALCRAANLLLGVAAVPEALRGSWRLGLIPLFYISGVTVLSRGEVHGGTRRIATAALVLVSVAVTGLLFLALRSENVAVAVLLAVVVMWRVVPPFWRARLAPGADTIRSAVRNGVLSLVLVDATIASAYAGPLYAASILAIGVAAGLLARRFAVT